MDPSILAIMIGIAGSIIGIIAGKFIFAKNTQKQLQEADLQAQKIIAEAQLNADKQKKDADTYKKERELEAKERFVQLKSEHEREVNQRNHKICLLYTSPSPRD